MTLVQMVTWRLLKRSASQPPGMLKQHERHGEEERDHRDKGLALVPGQAHADDHREQQVAQDVVAVGALELGGDQAQKPRSECFAEVDVRAGAFSRSSAQAAGLLGAD